MFNPFPRARRDHIASLSLILLLAAGTTGSTQQARGRFHLEEATIAHIQQAIRSGQITTAGLVELYLKRVKAYVSFSIRASTHC